MNELLNSYRRLRGCKLIERENQTRELIEALKRNESIGVTVDQGGKDGIRVKFFGKEASMATGALRLALKYGSVILPAYHARISGPYCKVIIERPFELTKSLDTEKDLRENLERLIPLYEKNILRYPQEYMWSYKIWKYARQKKILILSDGKAGHLRQSQAVAQLIKHAQEANGSSVDIETHEIKFKSGIMKRFFSAASILSGKYSCQGCLICARRSLEQGVYSSLAGVNPDLVISCGSSLAALNYLLSRENQARSVVIMRPSFLSTHRFDLVIMPRHDGPPKRRNVLVTEGALNLIDEGYLKEQSDKLLLRSPDIKVSGNIGFLVGGDSKYFKLSVDSLKEALEQLKRVCEDEHIDILTTTSRRTSKEIEGLIRTQLNGFPYAKLSVIANDRNIPEAVGGILGLSSVVVTTAESISMVSEASSSARYVFVLKAGGLSGKHQRFLDNLRDNNYIYLVEVHELGDKIKEVLRSKPPIKALKDREVVGEVVKRLL